MRCYLFFLIINYLFISKSFAILSEDRLLFVDNYQNLHRPWMRLANKDRDRVRSLVLTLKRSKTGRKILLKAQIKASQFGQTLVDIILPGENSITDTTLVRKFSPENPEEIIFESKSKVFIDRGHNLENALLDLAHELIHYIYKKPFNPYKNNFTVKSFMKSVVEGRGGEVEAYLMECKVLKELFPRRYLNNENCRMVINPKTGKLSKSYGVKAFYQMGSFYGNFVKEVQSFSLTKKDFPNLGKGMAHFISSAYGLPYPLAAIREFSTIMTRACANDSKRLGYMKDSVSREIASERKLNRQRSFEKMAVSYRGRCRPFLGREI